VVLADWLSRCSSEIHGLSAKTLLEAPRVVFTSIRRAIIAAESGSMPVAAEIG
jgi:hypothetical protein